MVSRSSLHRIAALFALATALAACAAGTAVAQMPGRNGMLVVGGYPPGDGCGFPPKSVVARASDSSDCDWDIGLHYALQPTTGKLVRSRIPTSLRNWVLGPDGRTLAYTRCGERSCRIVVAALAHPGRDLRATAVIRKCCGTLTWSPDGRRIAVETYTGIGIVDVSRSGQRPRVIEHDRHTAKTDLGVGQPHWSSRGRIAFVLWVGRGNAAYDELCTMRTDGSGEHVLRKTRADLITSLDWSPDGRRLVYTAEDDVGDTAYVASGNRTRPLLTGVYAPLVSQQAMWSPDGRYIAVDHEGGVDLVTPYGKRKRKLIANAWLLDWQTLPPGA